MWKQSFGERECTLGERTGPWGVIESLLVRECPDYSGGGFRGRWEGEKGGGDQDPEGNRTLWVLLVLLSPYLAHHQRENKLVVSDEVRRRRRGHRRPADRELLSGGALCLPSQLGKELTGPLLQQNSWV